MVRLLEMRCPVVLQSMLLQTSNWLLGGHLDFSHQCLLNEFFTWD